MGQNCVSITLTCNTNKFTMILFPWMLNYSLNPLKLFNLFLFEMKIYFFSFSNGTNGCFHKFTAALKCSCGSGCKKQKTNIIFWPRISIPPPGNIRVKPWLDAAGLDYYCRDGELMWSAGSCSLLSWWCGCFQIYEILIKTNCCCG